MAGRAPLAWLMALVFVAWQVHSLLCFFRNGPLTKAPRPLVYGPELESALPRSLRGEGGWNWLRGWPWHAM